MRLHQLVFCNVYLSTAVAILVLDKSLQLLSSFKLVTLSYRTQVSTSRIKILIYISAKNDTFYRDISGISKSISLIKIFDTKWRPLVANFKIFCKERIRHIISWKHLVAAILSLWTYIFFFPNGGQLFDNFLLADRLAIKRFNLLTQFLL